MEDVREVTPTAGTDAATGGDPAARADRRRALWISMLCIGCILVGMLAVGGYVWRRDGIAHRGRLEQALQTEAKRLVFPVKSTLKDGDTAALQDLADERRVLTGMRVTVMAPDGVVLADSHEDPAGMDNHGTRPEFLEAGETGTGRAMRFSDTLQEEFLYVAVAVEDGARRIGYVRTSMPRTDLLAMFREEMREAVWIGILSGMGLLLLCLGLGWVMVPGRASRGSRPIRWQLLVPLGTILVLLVLGAGVLIQTQRRRHMEGSQAERKRIIRETLLADLAVRTEGLVVAAGMVARSLGVAEAVRDGDTDALLRGMEDDYLRLEREYGVTHFNFITLEGEVLARLHNPVRRGDRLDRGLVREAIRSGSRATGLSTDGLGILTLWVVEPVILDGGVVGFTCLGRGLEGLLSGKRDQFGAEFVLLIPKASLSKSDWETGMQVLGRSGNWEAFPDRVVQYSTLDPLPEVLNQHLDALPLVQADHPDAEGTGAGDPFAGADIRDGERWWRVGVMSFDDGAGQTIADLVFMTDVTNEWAGYRRLLLHGSLFGGALLTVLLALVYMLLRRTDGRIMAQEAALLENGERLRVAYDRAETEKERARQEEALVKEVLGTISDAVILTDMKGWLTFICPNVKFIFAVPDEEIRARGTIAGVIPGFEHHVEAMQVGEEHSNIEHPILRPDGSVRHLLINVKRIEIAAGQVLYTMRDVTDRRHALDASRRNEERLRITLQSIGDAVLVTDREGRVTLMNPVAEILTGWGMAEAKGRPLGEVFRIVNARTREPAFDPVAHVLKTGETVGLANHTVLIARDGTEYQIADSASPIRHPSGEVEGVVLVFRDVTEEYAAREALRASEERLREAQEIAGMGHWDLDLVANHLTWSEMVYVLFGVTPETFTPTYAAFLERIDPRDRNHVDHAWRESIRLLKPSYRADHRIIRADGEVRWVMEESHITYDKTGEPIQASGIVLDITERKQQEFFRQLSRDVLDVLTRAVEFEASIYGVLRLLRESLHCDAVGIRLEDHGDYPYFAQTGFSRDFLLKENSLVERDAMGEICHNEDGTPCLECTCGLVLSGKTDPDNSLFTRGGSCWTNDSFPLLELPEEEDPRHHPRNECIHSQYASVALIPIRVAAQIRGLLQLNGKQKGLFSPTAIEMLEEIANTIGHALMRIQMEDALRESEKKYRMLSELAMEGIWVIDAEGCTTYVNPAMEGILGYAPDEMLGQSVFNFMDDAEKATCRENMEKRRRGIREVHEFTFLHKDGSRVLVRMSTSPITTEEGEYAGALALVTDITEQRQIEVNIRQMEKMSAVGQLAGGIAHNFNNQLTGVIGYAHMLLTQLTDPKLKGYVEQLLIGARRSAELTKQLLAFARMDAGVLKQVNLHHLVHEVVSMISHSMPSNIDIRQDLKANPAVVTADPGQIQNAILNLAINARDAMPDGGEMVFETSVVELDSAYCAMLPYEIDPGPYIRLCVTDSGVGIPPDVLPRIFEPFFTTKEVGEGTGMGLPTAYGAVKLHKGAINVYSEVGHGTTFKLYLPLSPGLVPESGHTKSPLPAPYPASILLIDDEALVRALGEDMLKAFGYDVRTYEDGVAGLAYYKDHWDTVDLVILDMVMPRMNGPAVYRAMREINPDAQVILASGYSLNGTAVELLQEGVRGFVQKPFDPVELSETLHNILQPERGEQADGVGGDDPGAAS